jgi:hypothetical protein
MTLRFRQPLFSLIAQKRPLCWLLFPLAIRSGSRLVSFPACTFSLTYGLHRSPTSVPYFPPPSPKDILLPLGTSVPSIIADFALLSRVSWGCDTKLVEVTRCRLLWRWARCLVALAGESLCGVALNLQYNWVRTDGRVSEGEGDVMLRRRVTMLRGLRKPRCETCQHCARSPLGGQGWCRHPRMTENGRYLRLVPERRLGCAHRMPVFWESAEGSARPGGEEGELVAEGTLAAARAK